MPPQARKMSMRMARAPIGNMMNSNHEIIVLNHNMNLFHELTL
jgi:hypothetical protein